MVRDVMCDIMARESVTAIKVVQESLYSYSINTVVVYIN